MDELKIDALNPNEAIEKAIENLIILPTPKMQV